MNKGIFIHFTQTGGSALRDIIRQNRGNSNVFMGSGYGVYESNSDTFNFYNLPGKDQKRINFIMGHHYFTVLYDQMGEWGEWITMLRNPVDRLLSEFYYVRSLPGHPHYEYYINHTFDSFMREGGQGSNKFAFWLNDGETPTTEVAFETAKCNLQDKFAAVGVTDQFHDSVDWFADIFEWRRHYTINRMYRNVVEHPTEDDLKPETRRLAIGINIYDYELYRYAKDSLKARKML